MEINADEIKNEHFPPSFQAMIQMQERKQSGRKRVTGRKRKEKKKRVELKMEARLMELIAQVFSCKGRLRKYMTKQYSEGYE